MAQFVISSDTEVWEVRYSASPADWAMDHIIKSRTAYERVYDKDARDGDHPHRVGRSLVVILVNKGTSPVKVARRYINAAHHKTIEKPTRITTELVASEYGG